MSTASKQQIIQALDQLPGESLAAVAEFVDFLRAKTLTGQGKAEGGRVVKLGGLWKGLTFSEQESGAHRRV